MNLSNFAVRRPITILMLTLIAVLLGTVSLTRLPIDLLPRLEIPVIVISTRYDGVGPQEIEKLITMPIEESVATMENLEEISSVSSEGSSLVIAELNFGTDMDVAALEMREKVDLIKGFLPEEAGAPMIMRIDPNSLPIISMALSGSDDLSELQEFAEDVIKPRLERLRGVASVDVSGGYDRQVNVKLNQQKLQGYGLSVDYIMQVISAENLSSPGGEVSHGQQRLTIRTTGEFESIHDIEDLVIPLRSGGIVHLRDIADVHFGYKEASTVTKINGGRSINVSVQKQSATNTVRVANGVKDELGQIAREYPNRNVGIILDQSKYIQQSIDNVVESAILGALLAILVLYIFFRNMRTTLVISVAIPISIIVSFILIYFSNITLNLMTLGGLALGVGMLVDNAIVVLENIYRYREEGYSRREAAVKGATEVGMAVTASTFTTVAVFLPIVFVEGITSTIFRELALTVTLSLLASLVVSLTLIPMLSSRVLKVDYAGTKKGIPIFSKLAAIFDRLFGRVREQYKRVLRWSLHNRKATVFIGLSVLVVSIVTVATVGAEFFPEMDQGQFTVTVSLPPGSELENTNEVVTQVEDILKNVDEVETIYTSIGTGGFAFGSQRTDRATINVLLTIMKNRNRSTSAVADEVRELVKDIPGARFEVEVASMAMMGGGFSGPPISITVKGDEIETLKHIGDDIVDVIKSVEGTREVKSNLGEGIPEVQISVDRKRASLYGLTTAQIANSVKANVMGRIATRYKYDGDEIDVLVTGDERFGQSLSNLEQLPVQTSLGVGVPLGHVAKIDIYKGPRAINREGQARVITVSAQIVGRDLGNVSGEIEEKLSAYQIPPGYAFEMGGQDKELREAFSDLFLALVLAVLLVYMILASQFESLLHPFTIMLSVPIAMSGGALGLFITRRTLSVPSLIGAIILAGIVVNDAIILVDYINTRRKQGESRFEAIANAGPIRLRPILITTLTTVLGLLPLAIGIGEGSEALAPLATVVIGGLSLATLLTLVFIPVVYTLFDDAAQFVKRKISRA